MWLTLVTSLPTNRARMARYGQILADGLWSRNPGLIQFLGICPLLAVSNSLINGLGLGLATTFVLVLSNFVVALIKPLVAQELRLPVFVLIIAALVTVVDLLAQAWFFDLWLNLGIFIPLIVTNCVILARAETFASREPPVAAIVDGLANGLGFAVVLITLGGLREIIGSGTLFAGAETLFGTTFAGMQLGSGGNGFLLALLPPGAFLGLALLIAAKNALEKYTSATANEDAAAINTDRETADS
jgi:electron transport complex protein RnfE